MLNDINIDQNEVLFEDLLKPEFVVKNKSLEKIPKKIKTKQKFGLQKKKKEKKKQKQKKGVIKTASKKTINYMKKANYLHPMTIKQLTIIMTKNLMTYPLQGTTAMQMLTCNKTNNN